MRTSSPGSRAALAAPLLVTAACAQLQYGENQRGTIKDSDVVARAFPDVEGIDLLSPAFTQPDTLPPGWTNGTDGPTGYTDFDYFYRRLADRNDWLTYQGATFSSEEGRPVPYLFLSSSTQEPSYTGNATKLKVYIQAAIHGDEPAADQSVMALLGKMDANQTWAASVLERMDIKILPRFNLDGVEYFQREIASNFDANRDHIKLARQQSRDIKRTFSEWSPHISIDMHEFTAPTVYGGGYQHGADALISGGINPNINQGIRDELLNRFIPAMGEKLESYGLRWEPYVTGASNETRSRIVFEEAVTEARTGRNAYGLTQTISFLCEMRGIRLADQHFQRRTATALLKLEAILETARDNHEEVYEAVEGGRAEFIESNDDIVITDYFELTNRTFTMVERETGDIVQVPIDFYVTTPSVANLTRERPEAYIIPRPWADVVERLEILGLEVETMSQLPLEGALATFVLPIETLEHEYRGNVQALNITSSSLDTEIYEGAVLNTVTTSPMERDIVLPEGSFWVSTRQKNAALAFIALEPENIDSYVTFNIIPMVAGDEYPVFRVMA